MGIIFNTPITDKKTGMKIGYVNVDFQLTETNRKLSISGYLRGHTDIESSKENNLPGIELIFAHRLEADENFIMKYDKGSVRDDIKASLYDYFKAIQPVDFSDSVDDI